MEENVSTIQQKSLKPNRFYFLLQIMLMTKTKLIKNWHTVRTLDSARKFNEVVRKKNHKLNSKMWKNDEKIKELEKKVKALRDANAVIETVDLREIPYEFTLHSKDIELDWTKITKIAKLGYRTIYKINNEWFTIVGRTVHDDIDNIKYKFEKLTQDELFWKLG